MALSTVTSDPVDRLTVARVDREVSFSGALDLCASVDIATAYDATGRSCSVAEARPRA